MQYLLYGPCLHDCQLDTSAAIRNAAPSRRFSHSSFLCSLESGIQRGAGHSFYNGTGTAPKSTAKVDILCGDFVKAEIFAEARQQIEGSLVCIAVRQGGETLAQLPGTIIHSDGIVATSASRLCYLKSKDLKATIDIKVLDTKETYEGFLLDADFSSKVAFIKIMSPEQQEVARFVNLDYHYPRSMAVAVGFTTDLCVFPHAEPCYCVGFTSSIANEIENEQTGARTSGRVIKAVLKDKGIVIGGPLVNPNVGVSGVIHYEDSFGIKATPIHDVLKCLELFKKQQATSYPKSVMFAWSYAYGGQLLKEFRVLLKLLFPGDVMENQL